MAQVRVNRNSPPKWHNTQSTHTHCSKHSLIIHFHLAHFTLHSLHQVEKPVYERPNNYSHLFLCGFIMIKWKWGQFEGGFCSSKQSNQFKSSESKVPQKDKMIFWKLSSQKWLNIIWLSFLHNVLKRQRSRKTTHFRAHNPNFYTFGCFSTIN